MPSATLFVDKAAPNLIEVGSVFYPFHTVTLATAFGSSGSTLQIFAGSYTAAAGNTFVAGADGKAFRLEAKLGKVTIGN